MSQILFRGDPHGEFDHIIEAVWEHKPAAVVLLGDLCPKRSPEEELSPILDDTEIWFIHGNHDTDSADEFDCVLGLQPDNPLYNRNLHGRVADVADVRIAGLGGVFRSGIWNPPEAPRFDSSKSYLRVCGKGNRWRDGLPLKHRSSIFPDEYDTLTKQRADVLVPHEAPTAHEYGFPALDALAQAMRVGKTFHGHHHTPISDYSCHRDRLKFEAHGVGECGITDLEGRVLLPGKPQVTRVKHA